MDIIGENLLQVFLSLGVVLAMIAVAALCLKYLNAATSNEAGLINIVTTKALGTKDKLVLIKVGEKYSLIGVSGAGIQSIRDYESLEDEIEVKHEQAFTHALSKIALKGVR